MTKIEQWDEGTWIGVIVVLVMVLAAALGMTCMITRTPQECHEFAESHASGEARPSADEIKVRYDRCISERERYAAPDK